MVFVSPDFMQLKLETLQYKQNHGGRYGYAEVTDVWVLSRSRTGKTVYTCSVLHIFRDGDEHFRSGEFTPTYSFLNDNFQFRGKSGESITQVMQRQGVRIVTTKEEAKEFL